MQIHLNRVSGALLAILVGSCAAQAQETPEVTIYSYRDPAHIRPLLRAVEAMADVRLKVVHDKGLIERIVSDGTGSDADVLLSAEFGQLVDAKDVGITQALRNADVERAVPAKYRDPEGHWFGLAVHTRAVFASKARVAQAEISYEELADPKWHGRICMRQATHTYNLSLIASMIAYHGREGAKVWLTGVKNNLGAKPTTSDRAAIKGVFETKCDVAVANTYYMGSPAGMPDGWGHIELQQWASATRIMYPNATGRGSHVSVAGVSLLKNAPNREAAVRVVEAFASPAGQTIYAAIMFSNPVISDLGKDGSKADSLPLTEIARLRKDAHDIAQEVGFDAAPGL